MKKKNTAALWAILLGTFGAQRFYLGQTGQGILSVLLFWTYIPTLLGVVQGLYWLLSSEESFDNKYNKQRIQRDQASVQREILEQLKKK